MSSPPPGAAPPRIAVMPLFYGRPDVVRGCLEPLIAGRGDGRYDILAIENPSEHSRENRDLLMDAMDRGEVAGAYFPEHNAVFNSLLIALARDLFGVAGRYDYLVLSDGDVAVGREPFVEQQALLEAHPLMSSCSLRLDVRQWRAESRAFLSTVHYASAALSAEISGQTYAITAGGFWMRMFRTPEILKLARMFDHNGIRMRDTTIDQFFRTCGMFPACTLQSMGVELPNGPLFDPDDRTKLKASRALKQLGQADVFYNDLSPGGSVYWPNLVETPEPAVTTLARPVAQEGAAVDPEVLATLPQGPRRAVLLTDHPLWTAPAPVVLVFERPMQRLLLAEDGGSVTLPLTALAEGEPYEPFLDEIAFDVRQPERWSRRVLKTAAQAAARALRPGSVLTVTTLDWQAAAQAYAKRLQLLEVAVHGPAPVLDAAALSAAKHGRVLDASTAFEPGRIIHVALEAGLELAGMERTFVDHARATILRLRRPR